MHDTLVVGVPLFGILAAAFFNNQGLTRLESRVESRFDKTDARIDRIQSELTAFRSEIHGEFEQFYRTPGQHDARIDNLEKRR